MTFRMKALASGIVVMSLAAAPAIAKVSPEEAERLGDELTPMGAEREGNGDEIPAWDGGLSNVPEGYEDDGHYVNPFPEDEPLFLLLTRATWTSTRTGCRPARSR